ncbi:hypothetical protein AMR72_10085 [Flavobacterium psychrophilum]|nr:hypothetical protein AMR72_10085 [Flavobacterium psychrophilum]AOE52827.1 hypothetical protein ALW18_10075 [Flavobacterium psychrophilum]
MLKQLYTILFFLGLFFFAFNEFEGIPALGEFQNEAGAFFFLAGFVVLLLHGKVGLPTKSPLFWLLIAFLLWCLVATLFNLPTVLNSYFKYTGGLNRFIRQYISLLLSCIVFFTLYWNVIKNMTVTDILLKIRKVFFLSLIVASAYGFIETVYVVFHIGPAYTILKLFGYLPFLEPKVHVDRISSISYEPPFLAIYLITVAGWMFSYIITEKRWFKFIPGLAVLVLTYFSGSRTALLVIFIQLGVFLSFLYKTPKYRKYIGYAAGFVVFAAIALLAYNAEKVIKSVETKLESLNFKDNLANNVSNQSRFGMQYASLKVWEENPVEGVGFGQQTYHSRHHYPGWATRNNYEFDLFYKNPKEKSFPPGYNIYTRLLAETGLVGTLIFVFIIYLSIKKSRFLARVKDGDEKVLAMILLITFTGFAINWLQIDTFRMYGFWLSLAVLIKLNSNKVITNE